MRNKRLGLFVACVGLVTLPWLSGYMAAAVHGAGEPVLASLASGSGPAPAAVWSPLVPSPAPDATPLQRGVSARRIGAVPYVGPSATIIGPKDGALIPDMAPLLDWENPPGVTQYHLQVLPAVSPSTGQPDGPGIDLIVGDAVLVAKSHYYLERPRLGIGNYILLSGMSYTWRVRVTDASVPVGASDPRWGPWAQGSFKTPPPTSSTISPVSPAPTSTVNTFRPTLVWANSDDRIFYYEVQVSKDPTFNTEPATATAMVYSELIHGGQASPPNSYTIPERFLLEAGTKYYWRVRPRAQGDGKPVDWAGPYTLTTMASPNSDPWLALINLYRTIAKLPQVVENSTWSAGCRSHARYMVKNDSPGHSEDADNPWYTPEGELCGRRGNVFVYSSTEIEDTAPIDGWMQGPFHALGLIDPRLVSVGYGTYRQAIGLWHMGAALDVLQGLELNLGASTTYPVLWPAEGTTTPLSAYTGSENPDPLTSCPGYSAPSGLPILLQLGTGRVVPDVTDHSFWQGDTELAHCVYDETSYTNPDDSAQALGRNVLAMRNAVVLIPRDPLTPGEEYTTSITANGQTYTWSFAVSPSAPSP